MQIHAFTFATVRLALIDAWRLANATRAVSIAYSLLFVAGGLAIMGGLLALGRAPFVIAAVGAFMLVGPAILAGFFGIAHSHETGGRPGLGSVAAGFAAAAPALWALALVCHGGGTLRAYPEYNKVVEVRGMHRVENPRIAQLHRLNLGTITSDATLDLRYAIGRRLGSIEEAFIAQLRPGTKFFFAGKTLEFVRLTDTEAIVRAARGRMHSRIRAIRWWRHSSLPKSSAARPG